MSNRKKVIFQFTDDSETGVDTIPVGGVIYIESMDSFFVKVSDAGLNYLTTVNGAIVLGNIESTKQYANGIIFPPEDIVRHNTYASTTRGGSVKMRLDTSDPTKPTLYMTTDGSNP